MHAAAQVLVGRHDFSTFRDTQCQAKSPVRTLDRLDVVRRGDLIEIYASARAFLHHQVRSMVGSLEHVGAGKWSRDDLKAALKPATAAAAEWSRRQPDCIFFQWITRRMVKTRRRRRKMKSEKPI